MKLITEINEDIKILNESKEGDLFIEGIFLQSNIKNRNGRIYPREVLEKEVGRYVESYVEKKRAFGELGHPQGPTINLERVSHIITELRQDGTNWIGKAKITDTPYGNIVKNLINEGAQLGVSSRAMGSLKESSRGKIVEDLYLSTAADIVADPSAPDAFVQGIMEGKEWIWDNGILREAEIAEIKKGISGKTRQELEESMARQFQLFLSRLK